jgi:hypothetical protein
MEELSSWFGHVFTPDEFPVLMLHILKTKLITTCDLAHPLVISIINDHLLIRISFVPWGSNAYVVFITVGTTMMFFCLTRHPWDGGERKTRVKRCQ